MKKIIFTIIMITNFAYALNVGDTISKPLQDKLNIQSNKVYVIDFFAAWCVSCKIELPLISKVNNDIDKSKYKIIGVNVDEDINEGKDFVKQLDLNFDIVYDPKNEVISSFEPIGIPAIYFVKDLKIEKVIFGAVHGIDDKIISILKDMEK